jgi:hypothetical protein
MGPARAPGRSYEVSLSAAHAALAGRERQVQGDDVAAQHACLGSQGDPVAGAHYLPDHDARGASHAVCYGRGRARDDRLKASRRSELADAAGSKRCLVSEVTSTDVPSKRADGVRDPTHENAAGCQGRSHLVERLQDLGLVEVLEQVGGRDRRIVSRTRGESGAEVPLVDPSNPCCVRECRLLWTEIYAFRVVSVCLQQSDKLALPAAKVDYGSSCRRRKEGADVAPVDKPDCLTAAGASVLRGVGLIKTALQVGKAHLSHVKILSEYNA